MTEKKDAVAEVKPPNPATVEKAMDKVNAGEELNEREQDALERQVKVDAERGYREVEWKGQKLYQSLITGHTAPTEFEVVQHHAQLHQANIADPRTAP